LVVFLQRFLHKSDQPSTHSLFCSRHGGSSQTHSRCSGEPERIAQPQRSLTESHCHRGHTPVTAPLPATLRSNALLNIDIVVCVRCTHTHTHAHASACPSCSRMSPRHAPRQLALAAQQLCYPHVCASLPLHCSCCPPQRALTSCGSALSTSKYWHLCTPTFLITLYPLLSLHAQFLLHAPLLPPVCTRGVFLLPPAHRVRFVHERIGLGIRRRALLLHCPSSHVLHVCTLREVDFFGVFVLAPHHSLLGVFIKQVSEQHRPFYRHHCHHCSPPASRSLRSTSSAARR
jgi:hypothetical protein